MSSRHTLTIGALAAAAGVACGAYGSHGLEDRLVTLGYETDLAERMAWFETGVKYLLFHAVGLILVSLLATLSPELRATGWVSSAFLLGIFLFCGSLFAMTLLPADWKKLGAIVPLGGLAFLLGWLTLAFQSWRSGTR